MWLKIFVISNVFILKIVISGEVGDVCTPNEDVPNGDCKLILDCEIALSNLERYGQHPFDRCGFDRKMEIVCCPIQDHNVKLTTKSPLDRFGDTRVQSLRIAENECQKIVDTTLPPLGLHIIGGENASSGEFPHMAALGYIDPQTPDGYAFDCAGSLISKIYVLTAAHCVVRQDRILPSIVRLGVVSIKEKKFNSRSDSNVADVIYHPNYRSIGKYHDLALIRLEKPVQFSEVVTPICLYTEDNDPDIPLSITGWGRISNRKNLRSTILQKANITTVPRNECERHYPQSHWGLQLRRGISEELICGRDRRGISDTCQGDSGGPLQGLTARDGHFRLVGVTAFGRGCGSTLPAVYTRVSHYIDWIASIVWRNYI